MPEAFNKTGHGLTDIVIAWDEFKADLHPEFFGGIRVIYARVELKALHHGWGLLQIIF